MAPDYTADREVAALFPIENAVNSIDVKIIKKSACSNYITIIPISEPVLLRERNYFRLKTDDNISYRIQFDCTGNIYKGASIEDIGEGGIGVLVHAASGIVRGTGVKLSIELPQHNDAITIMGKVAHCSKSHRDARAYKIGIRFHNVKPQNMKAITDFIEQSRAGTRKSKRAHNSRFASSTEAPSIYYQYNSNFKSLDSIGPL